MHTRSSAAGSVLSFQFVLPAALCCQLPLTSPTHVIVQGPVAVEEPGSVRSTAAAINAARKAIGAGDRIGGSRGIRSNECSRPPDTRGAVRHTGRRFRACGTKVISSVPAMSVEAPAPLTTNPAVRIGRDVWDELRSDGSYPPGDTRFSLRRTTEFVRSPLPLLLRNYERHGPIFSLRVLQQRFIFMLGPEANHHILVSHAKNFHWREGVRRPDPAAGRRAADDRRRLSPARAADHAAGVPPRLDRGLGRLHGPGVPARARAVAARGRGRHVPLDPRARDADRDARAARARPRPRGRHRRRAAAHFERALSFYGEDVRGRIQRGPGSPWSDMHASRRVLDEILYARSANGAHLARHERGRHPRDADRRRPTRTARSSQSARSATRR